MSIPVHSCPCGCGNSIPDRYFSCRASWWGLPEDLRRPIEGTASSTLFDPARRAAVADARRWFRERAALRDGAHR